MIYGIEVFSKVYIYYALISLFVIFLCLNHCLFCIAVRSKTITAVREFLFKYGLQHLYDCLLYHSVYDRRYTE